MICEHCGAKYTKKAACLHDCPRKRRGARPPARYAGSPTVPQLDLFEDFLRRGVAAQGAVDAILKRRPS